MELIVSLNYLPKVITTVRRKNGAYVNVLSREDTENYKSKFWSENHKKFRSNIVTNLDVHKWVEIFEQVVDEDVIDMSTFECIAFTNNFNNDTYEVDFEITFKFDVLDEDRFFIQSNKMKSLLCDWLNDYRGFIDTGDNGVWTCNDGIDVCYNGAKTIVYYDVIVEKDNLELKLSA